jgi:hypothetical protein
MSSPSPIITHYPTDFKGTEKRTLESGNFRVFEVFKLLPATMRWSMAGLRLQAIGKLHEIKIKQAERLPAQFGKFGLCVGGRCQHP